jgi:hypothetical protein
MNNMITDRNLYAWCKISYNQLENSPYLKVPFRLMKDSQVMGILVIRKLADGIINKYAKKCIYPRYNSYRFCLLVQTVYRFDK